MHKLGEGGMGGTLFSKKTFHLETKMHWLDWQIVRKQLDIMSTYDYVQNQGKLMMQSPENGQKPQFGQFFLRFQSQISPKCNIFWKIVVIQIEGDI